MRSSPCCHRFTVRSPRVPHGPRNGAAEAAARYPAIRNPAASKEKADADAPAAR